MLKIDIVIYKRLNGPNPLFFVNSSNYVSSIDLCIGLRKHAQAA